MKENPKIIRHRDNTFTLKFKFNNYKQLQTLAEHLLLSIIVMDQLPDKIKSKIKNDKNKSKSRKN